MTAIAGFVDDDKGVWIAGDSAGSDGWSLTTRKDPKVFVRNGFVFGFTSSFRMGQLIRYQFNPPPNTGLEDHEYLSTIFVDSLRKCLKDGGYAAKEKEQESGGVFLLGYRGRLYRVDSDYQIGESHDGYYACGCGADIVLGALFAMKNVSFSPERRLAVAILAAERHSAGVRGPVVTCHLPFELGN